MSGRRVTDAEITAALRAHLPEQAAPGVRDRVVATVAMTAQQRRAPWLIAGLVDADPIGRRQSLLIAATLLVGLALAGAAAAGALRLQQQEADPLLNLEQPADLAAFARSAYDRMPMLPPLTLTFLEDGSSMGRIYVDRSGAVRIERFAEPDATEPETYEILDGQARGELAVVGSDRVWVEQADAISEDPRVFVYAALSAGQFVPVAQQGCETAVSPGETYSHEPGSGWRYVGLEYVTGRPTHHIACLGDRWIDVETRLVLRGRSPVFDDAGKAVAGAFHTIEVTGIEFGEQPAELFAIAPPAGVSRITPEQECARDSSCSATPVPAFVPPAGSTPAPLPSPSPVRASNGWVAYVLQPTTSGTGPADIYLTREGSEPRLIAGGDDEHRHNACPTFSPDGSQLAYAQDQSVVVIGVDAEGRRVGPETRIPAPGPDGVPCPKWSPDGRSVAFTFLAETGYQALAVADVLTGSNVVLASDDAQGRVAGKWIANWGEFAWSPAGDVIAATEGADGIWLVPIDGGDPTLVRAGHFRGPVWSPDGSRLAVTTCSDECERDSVHILRVDGTAADVDVGHGEEPAWSPNGDRLAYSTLEGADPIVIVDADGSHARGVPYLSDNPDPQWGRASGVTWSPDGSRLLYIGYAPEELYAPVSVSLTGDSTPVVLAPPTFDLYEARTRDLAWQPVLP